MFKLRFLGKLSPYGMLFLRMGLGICFIMHGSQKIFGGPEVWKSVGGAMANWGITFYPVIWGFLAAFSEFTGGFLFIIGFLFRPAALMMSITMAVATTMHLKNGDDFGKYSHALELFFVFFGLIFVGPGRVSLDGE